MFFNILFSGFLLYTSAFNFSYTELEFGGRFCGNSSSCTNFHTENAAVQLIYREPQKCFCDEKCDVYDDCCIDSPLYNNSITAKMKNIYKFVCIETPDGYFYMKNRCPSSWTDENTRKLCEAFNDQDAWLMTDPLVGIYVTSFAGDKITYTNAHCARCNHDDLNFTYSIVYCVTNNFLASINPSYLNNTVYNSTLKKWQIKGSDEEMECNKLRPVINPHMTRRCLPELIKTCPPDSNFSDSCQLYTSIVYHRHTSYRNVHCALCNNASLEQLSCNSYNVRVVSCKSVKKTSSMSFSAVLDFKSSESVGMYQPCFGYYGLYDPYFKKCRQVYSNSEDCNLTSSNTYGCPRFHLTKSEYSYIAQNSSIFVPKYNKLFSSNNFYFPYGDDGDVAICISDSISRTLISKYKSYFDILTLVGITISIICLMTHLLVFSLVEHLRNLPGMNLASYCLSLLMTYCSFLLSDYAKDQAQICLLIAIATYYFLLTSFFWMLTTGFDVWRTIHWTAFKFRVIYHKQWKVFITYSCCSWLMPVVLVSISIVTETSDIIPKKFHPGFGTISCWFSNGEALFVFLVIPLRVIMALNLIFFFSSAFTIYSNRCAVMGRHSSQRSYVLKNFQLFSRLITLMGLTWIPGLIAAELDNEYAWFVFIVLNTLQGFFILVGFTCKKEVFNTLRGLFESFWFFICKNDRCSGIGAKKETSDMFECSTQLP